jgi:hypothetical protein
MSKQTKEDKEFKHMKDFSKYLKQHFNFRVQKSKYGTGLFAVQDIPKGRKCIAGHPPRTFIPVPTGGHKKYNKVADLYKTKTQWKKAGLTDPQISLMQDFMCRGSNKEYVPIPHLYDIMYPGLYQFSNHSSKPNIRIDGHYFVALRNIKQGEEIFHDYKKICGKNELIM